MYACVYIYIFTYIYICIYIYITITVTFLSRSMNEIKNLHYLPRASEPREVLFEDRTKAHADHVGQSFDWQSTAAVGVLKAVHFGEWWVFV